MGQSERNNFQASVRELLNGLDGFVSTRSVVGEPIRMGKATLIPLMETVTRTRTTAEWIGLLEDKAVPCGPINTIAQAFHILQRLNQAGNKGHGIMTNDILQCLKSFLYGTIFIYLGRRS